MKIKVSYVYIGVVLIAIAIVIVSGISMDTKQTENVMPNDEIHQGVTPDMGNNGKPGKGNVSQAFLHQMAMYKKAVEENPEDTLTMRKYAELLSAAHNVEKGTYYFKKILEIDPKRIDVMTALVYNYYSKGKIDSAEIFNERILNLAPKDLDALYNKGVLEAQKGNMEIAKKVWQKLVEIAPESGQGKQAKENLNQLSNSNNM